MTTTPQQPTDGPMDAGEAITHGGEFSLHHAQSEIVRSFARTTVVTAGQGGGKTTAGYWWLWTRMRLHPGESHLLGFPTFPLLTRVILNQPDPERLTLVEFLRRMGENPRLHQMEKRIECESGQIFFASGREMVAWEGAHVKSAWIDEFDEMELAGYRRAMERTRMRRGWVLLTGTPRHVRWVAEELQPRWERGDKRVKYITFPSVENPKYDMEAFLEAKESLPAWEFRRLYMGELAKREGGNVFRREWWGYYDELPELTHIVQAWDTAFKEKTKNDFSVCATWGVGPGGWYLIDVWRHRVQFPDLERAAVSLAQEFHPNAILVEDKASGQSLIQQLRRTTKLPVIPVSYRTHDDKYARASAVTGHVHAGRCFLPNGVTWVREFVDEHAEFPDYDFDDQVDTTSMALNYLAELTRNRPRISVGRTTRR